MGSSSLTESFYLYLWRSLNAPGTLYMAEGRDAAETLCRELMDSGYIVKVIETATDAEFELCEGKLCPALQQAAGRQFARQ
jgi:hypothetical protein